MKLPSRIAAVICFAVLTFSTLPALADQVRLVNGDIIRGWGITLDQGTLKLQSEPLGEVSVQQTQVSWVETEGPVWVIFDNKEKVRGTIRATIEGQMVIERDGGLVGPFAMKQLDTISPGDREPEEMRRRWNTAGNINMGVTASTGNTETERLYGDGTITAKQLDTRYTVRGEADYRKERGDEITDRALLKLKHDEFFTDRWYLYTNLGFEHDTGKALDLRTDIGTGMGYQILESDRIALSVEGGFSYVVEDNADSPDSYYPAARWSTDLRYDPLIKKIRLFHYNEIFGDLTGDEGIVLRTRSGLRYFVLEGLNATAQVNYDWDSTPSPGQVESDTTYLFTLGYAW